MSPPRAVTLPDGRTLCYKIYGDRDGAPLVFHHGTPGCHELGALLDAPASRAGVRVVAPSRPGSGPSDPAPGTGLADWSADCEALLDHVGIGEATHVGFSGGCPFAAAVADALPSRVSQLRLIGGPVPATASDPFGPLTATPRLLGAVLRGLGWLASVRGPGMVVDNLTDRSLAADVAETVAMDYRVAVAGGAAGPVRESRLLAGDWAVPAVDVPTTVYHGREDANVPVDAVADYWSGREGVTWRALDADHLGSLLEVREAVVETAATGPSPSSG